MHTPIVNNLLFDLGVVLVHLDYETALKEVLPLCSASPHKVRTFFGLDDREPMLAEYEAGRVSLDAYFEKFVEQTGFSEDLNRFLEIWNMIFSENTPMTAFAQEMAKTRPLYLVTNTGDCHVPRLYDVYPALRCFTDDATSYSLKAVKPEPAYYERAIAKFGIDPKTSLFIDDRSENIEAGQAFGLQTVLYTTPEETIPTILDRLSP